MSGDRGQLLDRDRNAVERPRPVVQVARLGFPRPGNRLVGVEHREGVYRALRRVRAGEDGLGQLDW